MALLLIGAVMILQRSEEAPAADQTPVVTEAPEGADTSTLGSRVACCRPRLSSGDGFTRGVYQGNLTMWIL